jgi:hypothetical protein
MLEKSNLTFALPSNWPESRQSRGNKKPELLFGSGHHGDGGGGWRGNYSRFEKLSLGCIYDSEVESAVQFFLPQLQIVLTQNQIKKDHFASIQLTGQDGPSSIFGQIITCSPREGDLRYVRRMEILFPRYDRMPGIVAVSENAILPAGFGEPITNYLFRIRVLGDPEDLSDFEGSDEDFQEKGFAPELSYEYADLQSFHIQSDEEKFTMPWVYVISSRWLSRLHPDIYGTITANIKNILMQKNRIIINYHPDGFQPLNKIFRLRPGVSSYWLHDADTVSDVLDITCQTFSGMITRPMADLLLQ